LCPVTYKYVQHYTFGSTNFILIVFLFFIKEFECSLASLNFSFIKIKAHRVPAIPPELRKTNINTAKIRRAATKTTSNLKDKRHGYVMSYIKQHRGGVVLNDVVSDRDFTTLHTSSCDLFYCLHSFFSS
jgi:hypothetical protein